MQNLNCCITFIWPFVRHIKVIETDLGAPHSHIGRKATSLACAIGSGADGIVVPTGATRPLCIVTIVLIALAAASTLDAAERVDDSRFRSVDAQGSEA